LWLHDQRQGTNSRITFGPFFVDQHSVWSPDGSRIEFSTSRLGGTAICLRPASGNGNEEILCQASSQTAPSDWSRDGRFLIFSMLGSNNQYDIWVLPLTGDRKPFPFLQTSASEDFGRLSPDGRWLAYQSNETGTMEVFVTAFPGRDGKWQISSQGGLIPMWSRDGNELFYISPDSKMMAVDVKSGTRFEHGPPKPLFDFPSLAAFGFDVSPDGKRFLVPAPLEQAQKPMTLIINWAADLKKR
jgi:Tol biopolymer transport system component